MAPSHHHCPEFEWRPREPKLFLLDLSPWLDIEIHRQTHPRTTVITFQGESDRGPYMPFLFILPTAAILLLSNSRGNLGLYPCSPPDYIELPDPLAGRPYERQVRRFSFSLEAARNHSEMAPIFEDVETRLPFRSSLTLDDMEKAAASSHDSRLPPADGAVIALPERIPFGHCLAPDEYEALLFVAYQPSQILGLDSWGELPHKAVIQLFEDFSFATYVDEPNMLFGFRHSPLNANDTAFFDDLSTSNNTDSIDRLTRSVPKNMQQPLQFLEMAGKAIKAIGTLGAKSGKAVAKAGRTVHKAG